MQVMLITPLQLRVLLGQEDDFLLERIDEVTSLPNKTAKEELILEMLWTRLEIITGARPSL